MVIDLRTVNKITKSQTHYVESQYGQALKIPYTWKTYSDAWNGYHLVPLDNKSIHLTTFITLFD